MRSFFQKCAVLLLAVGCFSSFSSQKLAAQKVFALSGNNLVSFDANSPNTVSTIGAVSGIAAGQMLAGIDFRPQTGELYGIGYNSATGEARIYTLNLTTAAATPIGMAPVSVAPNMGDLTFDFNPTVDRIRFMGSNRQNYRLHPVTGAIAATDGNLAFAATDANAAQNPQIGAGAYTNSYIASTATTLYNYDTKLNIFTSQNPPNNGTQNTVGASGIAVDPDNPAVDFDIWFDAATSMNWFFLAAKTGSSANSDLFTIDISTGKATMRGSIGTTVRDIAVQIVRNVPNLTGDLLYALTSNNWLISFDAANPAVVRTSMPVSGVAMGQVLVGMDFRPASGELYGLGYNSTTGEARLYTIKTNTAAATAVGAANITLPANLGRVGMDFNPTVDRIRVTTSTDANYRLHPITGALVATDANLNFSTTDANAGKNPNIGAVGYTNSFAGATTTTLYNYDDELNILTTQIPPNDGRLNTVGASGIAVNSTDQTSDLDIFWDKNSLSNRAYLIANVGTSSFDNLYNLNLTSGAATLVGRIGNGSSLVDLAAAIAPRVAVVCPANVTVTTALGQPTAMANYTAATAASGCNDGLLMPATRTSGLASGSAFLGGANVVCFSASDNCGNTGSCCFTVQVNETPCDVKTVGTIKTEMLNVRPDSKGNKIMRVRVTNTGASPLVYVAFQVQDGTTAVAPANNSTFTSTSGSKYTVRTPNYSPFYSIRFKSQGAGIKSGQSDIFEYTLPKVTALNYFHFAARTEDGTFSELYLNIYKCSPNLSPSDENDFQNEDFENENPAPAIRLMSSEVQILPNPSNGKLQIDLSDFSENEMQVAIFDAAGQLMARQFVSNAAGSMLDFSDASASWSNGLYFIEFRSGSGERLLRKWVLQR